MAEIVQAPPTTSPIEGLSGAIAWTIQHWYIILIMVLFIGALMIIYFLYVSREENDKRRDDAIYATAKFLEKSAKINKRDDWIRSRWSPKNLFWLGIPFIKNEHSKRIVDINHQLIGYYRGHTKTQGGDTVYLLYKEKIFLGLVEQPFMLYCPSTVTVESGGTRKVERLPTNLIQDDIRGNVIIIRCNTIQKLGEYYYFPNYVVLKDNEEYHIDLTNTIQNDIAKQSHIVTIERAYTAMSRAVTRAVDTNPELDIQKKLPQRERHIDEEQEL